MKALSQTRTADGQASFLAEAALDMDTGDVSQRIGEMLGEAVGVRFRRYDSHGPRCPGKTGAGFGGHGGVFGVAAGRDDDGFDGGRLFFGQGDGGRAHGGKQR